MPISKNGTKLRKNAVVEEKILFLCGVWKITEILQFKSGMQTTSSVSNIGDISV